MLTLQLRQPLLPWWATHCWPVIGLRHRALLVQVIQDFLDGDRIFYGSDDLDGTATGIAGLNIYIKDALQALGPGHRRMFLSRRLLR